MYAKKELQVEEYAGEDEQAYRPAMYLEGTCHCGGESSTYLTDDMVDNFAKPFPHLDS